MEVGVCRDGDVMVPWGKQVDMSIDRPTSLQYNVRIFNLCWLALCKG
jgi:hypothetical protein